MLQKLSRLKNGLKNFRKKFNPKEVVKTEEKKKEPEFKEELIGLDFINSRPELERPRLIAEIRLMAVVMTNPKMEYEDIIALPLDTFLTYLLSYRKAYKSIYERIASNTEQKSGFQFAKEEDYVKTAEGKASEGIRFSSVK